MDAASIERGNLCAPRFKIGVLAEFRHQFGGDHVAHDLLIGRGEAALGRQIIAGANDIAIKLQMARDGVDHSLARQHALRSAKAAKGGVGDGVGLQRKAEQICVGDEIAV